MFLSLFLQHSVESFKCDICELAKHHHVSFTPSYDKSVEPFDLINFDVLGPTPISNFLVQNCLFVSFIDARTQITWIFLMKDKSKVPQSFIKLYHMVQYKHNFEKVLKEDTNVVILLVVRNLSLKVSYFMRMCLLYFSSASRGEH